MLAATADVVFIVDESESARINEADVSLLHAWVAELAVKLDAKLNSRGIADNRYAITSIGGEELGIDKYAAHYNVDNPKNFNGSPRFIDLDNAPSTCDIQLWGTAGDISNSINTYDSLASGEEQSQELGGTREDGWWGIRFAAKGEEGSRTDPVPNVAPEPGEINPLCAGISSDTDGFADTLYDFRSNAAVHFILVTDEPSTEAIRTEANPDFSKDLDDLLEALDRSSLRDSDNTPNEISDAVVTAIVPTMFTLPGFTDPILGVDADVIDRYDVDVDDEIPSAISYDQQAHVFTLNSAGSVVHTESSGDFVEFYHVVGQQIITTPGGYIDDVLRLLDDGTVPYIQDPVQTPVGHLAQRHFFSERYAFLAWETGGTVWDVQYAVGPLCNSVTCAEENPVLLTADEIRLRSDPLSAFANDRTGVASPLFLKAVVDDIFEKIRMQVGDVDENGRFESLQTDIASYYAAALDIRDNPTTHQRNIDKLDMDGDGVFVDGNGEVDSDDIIRYMNLLGTWVGDIDYDFLYNSADFVDVFLIGEYEDGIEDNSYWSEGDWDFNEDFDSGDFVIAFLAGGYENGYIYVAPVWADSVFSGTIDFYLPTWGW